MTLPRPAALTLVGTGATAVITGLALIWAPLAVIVLGLVLMAAGGVMVDVDNPSKKAKP